MSIVTTSGTSRRLFAAGGVALGLLVLVLMHVHRGIEYWNFSEGVYALTSRLLLHGHDLYGHVVAAQPPGLFLAGAGILAVHDGLEWLRLVMGAVQLAGGVLGGVIVWRLTGSGWAAAAAPALVLLTPWAVHEHGALTPELFAAPLVLGGALLCSRPGRASVAGGALVALAAGFKLPFVIPVVLVVLAAADRRRAALGAVAVLAGGAALSFLIFGTGVWDDTVIAQLGTGRRDLHDLGGLWFQGGWNVLGLVLLAAVAVVRGREAFDDRRLFVTATAGALGLLLTFATNWKVGTALNTVEPVEAGLVPLALAGAVVLVRAAAWRGAALAAVALAFTLAQSAVLLAMPDRPTMPYLSPKALPGSFGWGFGEPKVRRFVREARACPPGAKYPQAPFIAFLAHRPVPDDQPDIFLPQYSPSLVAVARRIVSDGPVCPARPGSGGA